MSRENIADAARDYELYHGQITYNQMVCNQFVLAVLRKAVDANFPDLRADDFPSSDKFTKVESPLRGDLIHWPGHIGIVLDPNRGEFIGSQTSTGVAAASYSKGYWNGEYGGKRPNCFLMYTG